MRPLDQDLLLTFSDLLINLSAGWFAAIIIVPNLAGSLSASHWVILTGNLMAGIVALYFAFRLKKLAKEELYD